MFLHPLQQHNWLWGCIGNCNYERKNFNKIDFGNHPAGSLGAKLKTVEDIMLTKESIPFVDENFKMKYALKVLSKKLGILIAQKKKITTGIITDGQIRRSSQTNLIYLN